MKRFVQIQDFSLLFYVKQIIVHRYSIVNCILVIFTYFLEFFYHFFVF